MEDHSPVPRWRIEASPSAWLRCGCFWHMRSRAALKVTGPFGGTWEKQFWRVHQPTCSPVLGIELGRDSPVTWFPLGMCTEVELLGSDGAMSALTKQSVSPLSWMDCRDMDLAGGEITGGLPLWGDVSSLQPLSASWLPLAEKLSSFIPFRHDVLHFRPRPVELAHHGL